MAWLPKQSVIVPIDFSDESFAALDAALELVDKPAKIHVVFVLPLLEPAEPGVIWHTIDDASRRNHAEMALKEKLIENKYQGISIDIAFGDPGKEITDFAQKQKADLIVLPSHGRTGLTRLLLGSVAEKVIRLAHCPVLVLRK